ncbi:hypothetical protein Trydic_g9937 [Trypoxylus dichotomus]
MRTSHGQIDICSAYLPPRKDMTEEDLDQIFGTNNSTVLMGDLNAKHPSWNAKVTNSKGLALQQLAQDGGFLVLGPDEPIHIHTPTGTMDVLDVYQADKKESPDEGIQEDPSPRHQNGTQPSYKRNQRRPTGAIQLRMGQKSGKAKRRGPLPLEND